MPAEAQPGLTELIRFKCEADLKSRFWDLAKDRRKRPSVLLREVLWDYVRDREPGGQLNELFNDSIRKLAARHGKHLTDSDIRRITRIMDIKLPLSELTREVEHILRGKSAGLRGKSL